MSAADTCMRAALALAAEGLPVFPLPSDKRPACPGGFYAAKSDSAGIRNLWAGYPGAANRRPDRLGIGP